MTNHLPASAPIEAKDIPSPRKGALKDVLEGSLISLTSSMSLLGLVWMGGNWLNLYALPPFQTEVELSIYSLLSMVILGPALETLLLLFIMLLAHTVYPSRPISLLVGTVAMSAVHSYYAWMWGLIVWPIFFIGGLNYLRWRSAGKLIGIAVAAIIHALHNLASAALMSLL